MGKNFFLCVYSLFCNPATYYVDHITQTQIAKIFLFAKIPGEPVAV